MICSRCNKNLAVIFISRSDETNSPPLAYCIPCAKELKLPQVQNLMDSMGIDEKQIEMMNENFMQIISDMDEDGFEFGGAGLLPPNFLSGLFGGGRIDDKSPEKGKFVDKVIGNGNGNGKKEKEDKKKKLKYLGLYCTDLTAKAESGELDAVVGRDKELYRVEQILSRRSKNNPCLIGEPGVGKTAIAEGIAQKITNGDVAFRLLSKRVYLLDLTALVAGTQFRGQFESRLKGLIEEVKACGNIVLFIDEVHTLVGTGDSEGSQSAANILKPALSRGEIQVIGATTFNEYRKHIENDAALERRFQPVVINEPSITETIEILQGIKAYYEEHHKVVVSDEILTAAVTLSERYITDRFLPDKAIDLLDEACACRCLRSAELADYERLNRQLAEKIAMEEELETEPIESVDYEKYEKIAALKTEIDHIKNEIETLESKIPDLSVDMNDLARVVELWTGIPASKIEESEYKKISELETRLKSKIIGQNEAAELVTKAICRSRVQLSNRRRPASFIFAGPTGVGKTELVKVLSSELFDSVEPLIRLDMSEFMEKHAVSRLIGSPPGYVGYDEAGQLTEKVRRKPYSVILFDEIEKAHPDVMNILLQILDEGKVTDSHGRTVNFDNTVICMTSNAGSADKGGISGFGKTGNETNKDNIMKALKDFLRPEFLGRVDEVVIFNKLEDESLEQIAALMLDELKEPLNEKGITFEYDGETLKYLVRKSDGAKYGARDLRQIIRKQIEDKIASELIRSYASPPSTISIETDQEGIAIAKVPSH
ncbi:MAG: ATP-dependent Clp protease ATP-binding subunit [Oscillospiraceae bacterium]|nr:ATP-dependent Clp protease ATP-binding subunit [Oscillospiraceae bacterium]